jgi:dipeptide transport system permease protein
MTTDTLSPPAREPVSSAPPHPLREFWSYFSANPGAVAGLAIILTILAIAVTADLIAPQSPILTHGNAFLKPPFWQEGGSLAFPLGTDAIGRDILSRLLYGTRLSLLIGIMVVTIMRTMDVLLTLPSLLLAIVIVAILGPGLTNAMIAVAIAILPHYVRLTRAAVVGELAKEYVIASRVSGAGTLRLMLAVVLPNCMAPLIVQASLGFSDAILDAAALGFLGLGAQPPAPEWGTMLADSREFVLRAWWVVTFPGLFILITVLAFNLFGDGLRDALDPKLKR